ncbi:unnamed protein product [Effrenium voratum]|nr:unnamed protein product [Effrenium voratum]CAJ1417396.1 unnamed protein product [Effrenium voratum]CAJ1417397.1 unnamed protein product [Effrenium voratum]
MQWWSGCQVGFYAIRQSLTRQLVSGKLSGTWNHVEDAEHCLEVVRRNLLLACACKPSGLAAGTGAAMAHKSNPYKKARSKFRWKWKKKRTRRLQKKRRKMRQRSK